METIRITQSILCGALRWRLVWRTSLSSPSLINRQPIGKNRFLASNHFTPGLWLGKPYFRVAFLKSQFHSLSESRSWNLLSAWKWFTGENQRSGLFLHNIPQDPPRAPQGKWMELGGRAQTAMEWRMLPAGGEQNVVAHASCRRRAECR